MADLFRSRAIMKSMRNVKAVSDNSPKFPDGSRRAELDSPLDFERTSVNRGAIAAFAAVTKMSIICEVSRSCRDLHAIPLFLLIVFVGSLSRLQPGRREYRVIWLNSIKLAWCDRSNPIKTKTNDTAKLASASYKFSPSSPEVKLEQLRD